MHLHHLGPTNESWGSSDQWKESSAKQAKGQLEFHLSAEKTECTTNVLYDMATHHPIAAPLAYKWTQWPFEHVGAVSSPMHLTQPEQRIQALRCNIAAKMQQPALKSGNLIWHHLVLVGHQVPNTAGSWSQQWSCEHHQQSYQLRK